MTINNKLLTFLFICLFVNQEVKAVRFEVWTEEYLRSMHDICNGAEGVLALIRIPLVCAANTSTFTKDKSTAQKVIVIAADLVRFYGEIFSVINKEDARDLHGFDYFWIFQDGVSVIKHMIEINTPPNKENINAKPEELKKLNRILKELHEVFLPFIEGVSAFLYASLVNYENEPKSLVELRNLCKSINSMSRVLDRLIVSEDKTFEQYAWSVALVFNIISSYALLDKYCKLVLSEKREKAEEDYKRYKSFEDDFFKSYSRASGAGGSSSSGTSYGGFAQADPRADACRILGISRQESWNRDVVNKAYRRAAKADPSRLREINGARDTLVPRESHLVYGPGRDATGM